MRPAKAGRILLALYCLEDFQIAFLQVLFCVLRASRFFTYSWHPFASEECKSLVALPTAGAPL